MWRTDLNDTQKKIIKLLSEDHQLSAVKLAEKIGVASRNIENNIKKLKEYGILIRHGSPKNGYWEIEMCIRDSYTTDTKCRLSISCW